MRFLSAALAVALALGAASGSATAAGAPATIRPLPAFTVGEESAGGTVSLAAGAVFAVELESSPAGGYVWSLARTDPAVVELVAEEVAPAGGEGGAAALGAAARQRFLLRALAPGAADLAFALARPWQPGEPLRTFALRVVVAPRAD